MQKLKVRYGIRLLCGESLPAGVRALGFIGAMGLVLVGVR
jgi:hypothetical protein